MRQGTKLLGMFVICAVSIGCDSSARRQVVNGRLEVTAGSLDLKGHLIEVALDTEPTVRGSGLIEEGGKFKLEMLDQGKPAGVKPGSYRARVVIVDEGDGQTPRPKVPARYLDFKTSGWQLTVPTTGEVKLELVAK